MTLKIGMAWNHICSQNTRLGNRSGDSKSVSAAKIRSYQQSTWFWLRIWVLWLAIFVIGYDVVSLLRFDDAWGRKYAGTLNGNEEKTSNHSVYYTCITYVEIIKLIRIWIITMCSALIRGSQWKEKRQHWTRMETQTWANRMGVYYPQLVPCDFGLKRPEK